MPADDQNTEENKDNETPEIPPEDQNNEEGEETKDDAETIKKDDKKKTKKLIFEESQLEETEDVGLGGPLFVGVSIIIASFFFVFWVFVSALFGL